MLLRAVVIAALLGCGGEPEEAAPVEPPTETPAEPETEIEDEEEEELEEEDDTPPSFTRAELDAMERPQLEEACYAGSQAACDRLGH